ncbi:inositol-pentakisphosphate 2-kinase [Trametes punicea]|nr:inositol-pentakisphosphate 2-kinase [Trametes punicea]
MSDAPNIEQTSPHDWKYISEGGSSIVFSYAGPPRPQFDGTALRLRKRPVPAREEQCAQVGEGLRVTAEEEDPAEDPDDPTIVFQRTVIERLLSPAHLPRLHAVRVGRAWLDELAAIAEPLRPLERRAVDRIDTDRRKAVLATDLVGGDGWAVEIKPKWGFLPAPTHLSPATRPLKTRTCRFCMHAHLKSTRGTGTGTDAVAAALGYCPLDLFSREPARVRRALHALWDAWIGSGGAVNNLRVFVRGRAVRPSVDVRRPLDALRDAFTAALLPVLLHTPVLRTLSTLQRTLDALDIEGLAALWARVRRDARPLGAGESDPDVHEWAAFVDAYLARRRWAARDGGALGTMEVEADAEAELRYRLLAYLLSASFKDCSIIIRMPPPSPPSPSPSSSSAPAFGTPQEAVPGAEVRKTAATARATATVTVIDLDVKPVSRLAKWAQLDREIVDAYRDVRPPRVCLDGDGDVHADVNADI